MKLSGILFFCLFSLNFLSAQQTFTVPEITADQEKEILYNHVIAYFGAGITFAKTQGVSPEAYGKHIGTQFKPFWDPNAGFVFFTNQLMFIMKGVNSFSEMEIIEQSDKMIRFKMSNLDLLFKQGPMYGITYKEFLAASGGLLATLAEYMKVSFVQTVDDEGWYVVTMKEK